jgi:hexosaminidase
LKTRDKLELRMTASPLHFGCRKFARLTHLRISAALALPLILAAPLCAQQAPPADENGFVNTLMPLPVTLVSKPGNLRIDSSFSYALRDKSGERLRQGVERLLNRMELRSGNMLAKEPAPKDREATLTIDVAALLNPAAPALGEDESYTLDVDEHHVSLHAPTDVGALRGMETLLQLVQPAGAGFVFPAVHIEDAPRFPWRGLLIDPGRHFLPVPVIYRTLDGMAAVKLNLLHWHLTEDQGFRIESRVFPKLHELGSEGLYYTQQQVRDVIAYAAARGIRVVPEFDMPGHSTSWMVGYPELGSAPGPYSVDNRFGIHDPAMNPINESTYRFLDAFLGEMSKLFPDAYIHVGGDESNGKQWLANPRIKAFMDSHGMKTTQELQAYFNVRLQKILAKYHKQMVGWDEVLNPALTPDVVIQSWRTNESLIEAAKQGHRGFYSHPYYLDHMYSAAEMFLANPIAADAALTPDQAKLILGGEACMWGEMVNPATIDSRIWPRAAAVAERFWSPASDQDTEDMYRRLAVESLRLEAEGLMHMSGPVRIQRQIAGFTHIQPLELFVSTLQPVDFHIRGREQQTTQFTVLDRLVDAARYDPPLRHEFELLVNGALHGNTADMDRLDTIFHSWVDAAPALNDLAANSPLLQEVQAHIAAWPKLGAMGIEAVHYLRTGDTPHTGWQDTQKAVLHDAVKPSELVDFVVLGPLGKLVEAAGAPRAH